MKECENEKDFWKEWKHPPVYIGRQTDDRHMIQSSFLGKDGLTITSANHLANIAKEMFEAAENKLESIKLYSRDFRLAVNGQTFRVENESERSELSELSEGLKEVGELKSLIAYLREGIKAKDRISTDMAFDKHIEELIKEGREDLKKPEAMEEATFEEEFGKLTAEQKAKYYALEAKCATIGEFIHPDGVFAKARKAFFENRKNPTRVSGKGQEAEISTFTSSFTAEEVDNEFFTLQREYRNIQAELNRMKADVDTRVASANGCAANSNFASTQIWTKARNVERVKYNEQVKALKIVIPQNLRDVYERVNRVASEK